MHGDGEQQGGSVLTLQADQHLRARKKKTSVKKTPREGAIECVYLRTNEANLPIVSRWGTIMGTIGEYFFLFPKKQRWGRETRNYGRCSRAD